MPVIPEMIAAVHAYVAAFEAGDAAAAAALFAEDATVEDPIGSPLHRGREAIQAFYAQSMATGAKLKLEGPIRTAGDYAVFPFSVNLTLAAGPAQIDVIDSFKFNDAGQVVEMRAFWGPSNMHGF
jgi:steroid delta-isomerase